MALSALLQLLLDVSLNCICEQKTIHLTVRIQIARQPVFFGNLIFPSTTHMSKLLTTIYCHSSALSIIHQMAISALLQRLLEFSLNCICEQKTTHITVRIQIAHQPVLFGSLTGQGTTHMSKLFTAILQSE